MGRFRGVLKVSEASWCFIKQSYGLLEPPWGILGASWSVLRRSRGPRRTLAQCGAGAARVRRGCGAGAAWRKMLPAVPQGRPSSRKKKVNNYNTGIYRSSDTPWAGGPANLFYMCLNLFIHLLRFVEIWKTLENPGVSWRGVLEAS